MVYKLNVTEHADELLDKLVYHLIYQLKMTRQRSISFQERVSRGCCATDELYYHF